MTTAIKFVDVTEVPGHNRRKRIQEVMDVLAGENQCPACKQHRLVYLWPAQYVRCEACKQGWCVCGLGTGMCPPAPGWNMTTMARAPCNCQSCQADRFRKMKEYFSLAD